jgi:hypothetical protein
MAEDGHISSAVIAVFAWYVPHVGMDMVEHFKSARIASSSGEPKQVAAIRTTVVVHSVLAVAVGLVVLAATAVGVALSTQNLDDRMETILVGMSRIVAALMLCFVSYKFPKWCGLYPSLKRDARREVQRGGSRTTNESSSRPLSLRILAFNVRWSIWRHLGKQFFVLMPFYCGVQAMTIPVSMLIGSAGGALILMCVYVGAIFFRRRHTILVPVFMAIGLAALSAIAFSSGCYYIGDVWGGTSASIFGSAKVLAYVSFAVWFLSILLVHSLMLKCSAGRIAAPPKDKDEAPSPATSTSSNIVASPATAAPDKASILDDTERTASDNEEECEEAVIEELAPVSESTCDDGTNGVAIAKEPTWCELVRGKLCCCAQKYDNRPRQSCLGRVMSAFKWVLWIAISGFCLFVTIVNIGSTFQQQETSESLVTVQSTLYNNMNEGPVCAIKNRGVNSTMRTFDNLQAANDEGFLVVHCGECAACSSWRNLKALWQSRLEISDLSRQCGRRTLAPGGHDEAIQCHVNTIGFDEACSTCYVAEEICARNHCAFISLQSDLIDRMASLPSDPDGADATDCSDVMCAANFLPCAGANRRRMNVQLKSDDSLPQNEQCQIVQVNWKDLFMDDFYVH